MLSPAFSLAPATSWRSRRRTPTRSARTGTRRWRCRRCRRAWRPWPRAASVRRSRRCETGKFDRIEVAGSVRRMKDTVGDINLVASAPDAETALDAFAEHAEAREVLDRAPGEMCVMTENGLRVDIRLTTGQPFAALLQRFTGSEEHNEGLRRRAAERSLALGPDGLSDGESGGAIPVE